jgi:hypothetical protein
MRHRGSALWIAWVIVGHLWVQCLGHPPQYTITPKTFGSYMHLVHYQYGSELDQTCDFSSLTVGDWHSHISVPASPSTPPPPPPTPHHYTERGT